MVIQRRCGAARKRTYIQLKGEATSVMLAIQRPASYNVFLSSGGRAVRRDEKNARNAGLYLAKFISENQEDWGHLMRDTHPNQGYGNTKAAIDAHDSAQWLYTFMAPEFGTCSMPGVFASPAAFWKALIDLEKRLAHRQAQLNGHIAASPAMTPITVMGVLEKIDNCIDAVAHAKTKLAPVAAAPIATSLDKALLIATRFPAVVASLGHRPQKREPLTIADEYDLQYLFEAVLALHFDDIRTEESGGSFGGGSIRLDTLLATDGVAIEYKMTRPGLGAIALRKQLNDDIMAHKENPKISQLLIFVYDPAKRIRNPRGFEADLSKPVERLGTITTIIQQG